MPRALSTRDAALRRAQDGGAQERADFIRDHYDFIRRHVMRRARRFAHLIDPDELTQEVFCSLMDPEAPRYEPSAGSCARYLERLLFDALSYRRRRWRAEQRRALTEHIETSLRRRRGVWRAGAELDVAARWLAPQAHRLTVETVYALSEVITAAPPEVREELRLVFLEGETQRSVAARRGLTPSTFCRRMQDFYAAARARLAC